MTNPITPPPELIEEWWGDRPSGTSIARLATQAAQWGADQELEACCEYMQPPLAKELRAARRPKPPSLKEQAMEQLACIQTDLNKFGMGISTHTIRRALEALPNA
jgi:hypothetical protein